MKKSSIAETVEKLQRDGLTGKEISEKTGHSQQYISQLLSGKRGLRGLYPMGRPRKPTLDLQLFGPSAELLYKMGKLAEEHGARLVRT